MQEPTHTLLSTANTTASARRTMIIGTVVMLHGLIVYALISGMAGKIAKYVPPELVAHFDTAPTKTAVVPPPPVLAHPQPQIADVPTPVINTVPDQPSPIVVQPAPTNTAPPAQPDTGAAGISSTHSTPPYPALARVAAHQGTAVLQIVISAEGNVASANVIQSSGFPELDQAAVTWVVAHWKYKPALQNGQPVPSQAQAAVKFDLRQASR